MSQHGATKRETTVDKPKLSVKATIGIDHVDHDEVPLTGRVELAKSNDGVQVLIIPDEFDFICAWATIPLIEWENLLKRLDESHAGTS